MGIIEYKNTKGEKLYIFQGEGSPPSGYKQVFTTVSIVSATAKFMLENPMLDSMFTLHDLDAQLNREAAEERELKQYQEVVRNL